MKQLVAQLSLEEKASLTAGRDAWHVCGLERIGLVPMQTLDGPNGVRGTTLPPGSTTTCTPCGTALGATWDVDLVREVAARIGLEARRVGTHFLLAPVLNMVRSPLGGRVFEAFGEDPVLVARIGAAYVEGVQSAGVAATPKHFTANDSETRRTSVDCRIDERTLREVYLLPFEAAAQAGSWAMMAAYNLVNGVHCSDNRHLVGEILRGEWGWDGALMSDWDGTDDTVAGASAGLDLEMPGPARFFGPRLAAAVRDGRLDASVVDDQARRLLTLAARLGALPGGEQPLRGPDPSLPAGRPWHLSDDAARALVRRAAAESFVLLANDGILPLGPEKLRRIAVIGPNAVRPCTQGGGSAHVKSPPPVTPLAGLAAALPGVEIVHREGCRIDRFVPSVTDLGAVDLDGRPGLTVEYFRGQEPAGEPVARWHSESAEGHFFGDLPPGLPQDDFSVRMSCRLTPIRSGPHRIVIRGFGARRLKVDGVVAADLWDIVPDRDVPTALFQGREDGDVLELRAGTPVLVEAELHSQAALPYRLILGCAAPEDAEGVVGAAAAAAAADVAVVVVGTDEAWESEGRDRETTSLPGAQDELVEAVAAANRRTVVVVNAGCPVDLPWSDRVAAVIYAFLPGQEFGDALADVLTGRVEPGGRLPFSLAARESDYAALSTAPEPDGRLVYSEGVEIGYRHFDARRIEPRFCFGHGLGYTRIEFESVELAPSGSARAGRTSGGGGPIGAGPLDVRVRLRNAGSRPGKAVVQVYVSDPEASLPRPPRELKAFQAVRLGAGESTEVILGLQARDFAFWDEAASRWQVEPGRFEIQVGASSRDIRLRAALEPV